MGTSNLRNQRCLLTKHEQNGQKQSKFFPSAFMLLSIEAGWLCPGKISRRFILSSRLIHRANDTLGASPQEKIKFTVIFHFKSQLPDQQLTLTTFCYYWLKRGWLEEVTKRQRLLYLWSPMQLSPQAVDFKLKKLEIGLVKSSVLFLGPKCIIISTCPQNTEILQAGRNIRRSPGPPTCLKKVQLEQAALSVFEYHQGRRVNDLSGPPVSMNLSRWCFFLYIEKFILWPLPPLKDLNLRRVSQKLSEFFIQNNFRLEDISLINTRGFFSS